METKLINYISMLEEEIKRIKNEWYSPNSVGDKEKYFRDHLQKYREEIKELKAELKDAKYYYSKEMIKKLQMEKEELKHELKHKAIKLNQSHYPKEYQAEADEWFEHNPQDEKLFFFMVGGSGVDEVGELINK